MKYTAHNSIPDVRKLEALSFSVTGCRAWFPDSF
jgi:hypothetical protein